MIKLDLGKMGRSVAHLHHSEEKLLNDLKLNTTEPGRGGRALLKEDVLAGLQVLNWKRIWWAGGKAKCGECL